MHGVCVMAMACGPIATKLAKGAEATLGTARQRPRVSSGSHFGHISLSRMRHVGTSHCFHTVLDRSSNSTPGFFSYIQAQPEGEEIYSRRQWSFQHSLENFELSCVIDLRLP